MIYVFMINMFLYAYYALHLTNIWKFYIGRLYKLFFSCLFPHAYYAIHLTNNFDDM